MGDGPRKAIHCLRHNKNTGQHLETDVGSFILTCLIIVLMSLIALTTSVGSSLIKRLTV